MKDIAAELQVSEEQIRKWKNQDKWDKVTLPNAKGNVTNHKGAPAGNQNAVGHGAPKQNKNAEKYGFFSKYLPEETVSIIQEMPTDPLDILWDQVQIAYAAIIRAQSIMYVRDQKDVTITKIGHKDGETVTEERWEVQRPGTSREISCRRRPEPRKRWRVLSNSMMSSCIKTGSWPVRSRRRGLHSSGRRRIS